jgi:hypothetical protein
VYSSSSPHQNIQRSKRDPAGGRMKVETYCTAKKRKREVNEKVKMVEKAYGEIEERERERESYFGCKTLDELF